MKKVLFLLLIVNVLVTSCKKIDSESFEEYIVWQNDTIYCEVPPLLYNQTELVVTRPNNIYIVDKQSGAINKIYRDSIFMLNSPFYKSFYVYKHHLISVFYEHSFMFDLQTGKIIKRFPNVSTLDLFAFDDMVFVANRNTLGTDSKISLIDMNSGVEKELPFKFNKDSFQKNSVTAYLNTLGELCMVTLQNFDNDSIISYNTEQYKIEYVISKTQYKISNHMNSIRSGNNKLFIGFYNNTENTTLAFDLQRGKYLWKNNELEGYDAVYADNKLMSLSETFVAVDVTNGKTLVKKSMPTYWRGEMPINSYYKGVFYQGCGISGLYAIDVRNGRMLASEVETNYSWITFDPQTDIGYTDIGFKLTAFRHLK